MSAPTAGADRLEVIGRSSEIWRGDGQHSVEPGCWWTLSGLPTVDYNVACCYGPGSEPLSATVAEVLRARRPTVLLVGGDALGGVQMLVDEAWVCIGSTPVMSLALPGGLQASRADELSDVDVLSDASDEQAGPVAPEELGEVRALVEGAFGIPSEWARIAVPDRGARSAGATVWALRTAEGFRSVLVAVRVGTTLVVWSMATLPRDQGRGYGRRLLAALQRWAASSGIEEITLYSSVAGRRLYTRSGFVVVDRLQQWSRPRWVLGGV